MERKRARAQGHRSSTCRRSSVRSLDEDAEKATEGMGLRPLDFGVVFASSAGTRGQVTNLRTYSRSSAWESFSRRQKETVVLELSSKALVSELCVLNKNACRMDVSVAMRNKRRCYMDVKELQHLPHEREVRVNLGSIPCNFIKLQFTLDRRTSISVYGIKCVGVSSMDLESSSDPSLTELVSYTPETILFGPSLKASQPTEDFLSDHRSGSPEWMAKRGRSLLDERIARLEAVLFS